MTRAVVETGLPPIGRRARPRAAALSELAAQIRPQVLANDEHLPLRADLQEALGLPGLRRGSLVVCRGSQASGTTSLALSLVSAPSTAGSWVAVVGAPDLGVLAAVELGVALDRLILVPRPGRRAAGALATLIEGCDLVLVGGGLQLSRQDKVALIARVRQRRIVLVALERERSRPAAWPEIPDVTIEVASSAVVGAGHGDGRISARRLELSTRQRRGAMIPREGVLWLPGPPAGALEGVQDLPARRADTGAPPATLALP